VERTAHDVPVSCEAGGWRRVVWPTGDAQHPTLLQVTINRSQRHESRLPLPPRQRMLLLIAVRSTLARYFACARLCTRAGMDAASAQPAACSGVEYPHSLK
jgi:hypothetical protein